MNDIQNFFGGDGDGDIDKNEDFALTVTTHGDVSPSCPDKKSKEFL